MGYICSFVFIILIEDIFLIKFLKKDYLLKTKKLEEELIIIGVSTIGITLISSLLTALVYTFSYELFNNIAYEELWYLCIVSLSLLCFEIIYRKLQAKITDSIRYYIPLVTINVIGLVILLLNSSNDYSLINLLTTSFGSAIGLTFALYLFTLVRKQINMDKVPKKLRYVPIYIVIAMIIIIVLNQCIRYI